MLILKSTKLCFVPIVIVLIWLAFSWSLAFVVDIFRLLDFYSVIPDPKYDFPMLWYYLFSEASPTEKLQWSFQLLGLLCVLTLWARLRNSNNQRSVYWFALSAGLFIMLIEDSLNFRHITYSYYIEDHLSSFDGMVRYHKTIWEVFFYSLLSSLMIYSGFNLVKILKPDRTCLVYLVTGYFLYGIVAFGSAMRRVYDWQERLGEWIIEKYALYEIPYWAYASDSLAYARDNIEGYTHTMGYLLIDHWYEETLELLAAGFLITGVLLLIKCDVFKN